VSGRIAVAFCDRDGAVAISEDVTRLEAKAAAALAELYAGLTPWPATGFSKSR
jgi:acetyl-CoA carboxylase carboxyl transferase subunit alpha